MASKLSSRATRSDDGCRWQGRSVKRPLHRRTRGGCILFRCKSKLNGKYAIINLDGTALDVALVEVKGGEVTLLRQEGGLKIGTLNVDEALLEVLSEKFKSITGDYFDQTDCYFDRLSVSHTKENLISRPNCDVRLVSAKHGPLKVEITRQELEAKIKYLAHHVKIACENITQIGTKGQTEQTINEEVQEIFMIGDISLIPFMKEAVESFSPKSRRLRMLTKQSPWVQPCSSPNGSSRLIMALSENWAKHVT